MMTKHGDPPTDRQREVLQFIVDHTTAKKCPPSLREIGKCLHIGMNGVARHLLGLSHRGMISCEANRSRTLRVTETGHAALAVAWKPREWSVFMSELAAQVEAHRPLVTSPSTITFFVSEPAVSTKLVFVDVWQEAADVPKTA